MANTIKLKSSSVAGKAPTTADLQLRELAINTTDGKLFLKKSVSGTESIVEIGAGGGGSGTVTSVSGTAPISVATGTTTPAISIADASTTVKGAVQLTDSTSSTSTTTAATPNSVKTAYDLASTTSTTATAALPKAGGTMTGNLLMDNQSDVRFGEATANGTNWVAFQGAASIASNITWTLPSADATVAGQALVSNASGTLSWATAGGGGTVTSVSGTGPISVATGTTTPAISIADGSTTVKGAVQLTDSTSSTSTTTAATPNSVKTAYDLASTTSTTAAAALPKAGGTMTGAIVLSGAPTTGLNPTTKTYVDAADATLTTAAAAAQTTANAAVVRAGDTMTGTLAHPLGAAATPSITFTGDLNTGVWSPTADTLAASTAGSERLRITSAGRVGIGVTNPGAPLNVIGSIWAQHGTASDGGILVLKANTGTQAGCSIESSFHTGGYGPLTFATSNTERLRITSAGLLGVGTSSPWSLATVGSTGTAGDVTSARQISVGFASNYNASFGYYQTGSSQPFAGVLQALDGGAGARLLLNPSGGNVGIGTTDPSDRGGQKLTVRTGSIATSNNTSNGSNGELRFIGTPDSTNYNWAGIRAISDVNTNQGVLAFFTSASNTSAESSTERFRIGSAGQLGIGGANYGTSGQVLTSGGDSAPPTWSTSSGTPAGAVDYFAMSSAPTGYLKANGAAISRSTYSDLFAAIGTTFGAGDGSTTFQLPDLRGEFIRGWDDARGVDTSRTFGSAQADDFKSHTHPFTASVSSINQGSGISGTPKGTGPSGSTTGATGGTETRPRNIALLACIKF